MIADYIGKGPGTCEFSITILVLVVIVVMFIRTIIVYPSSFCTNVYLWLVGLYL